MLDRPFASHAPLMRVKKGAPPLTRPTKEEVARFPHEAHTLYQHTWAMQKSFMRTNDYSLDWLRDSHFLLAGATGNGIGGALAIAIQHLLGEKGSLTVISRDLKRSLNYETGKIMQANAQANNWQERFQWLNTGLALDGKQFAKIITALQKMGVKKVVYINTVAAASSGLLPNMPSVYVKDIDEHGLFQWELTPLDDLAIKATKFVMGTLAVQFPHVLENAGIEIVAQVFADWRGSLDELSRIPDHAEYGRQGAYSTSLYLPKLIIQETVRENYGSGKIMMDIFYPMMRTRALPFIPGGTVASYMFDTLMEKENITPVRQPELALDALHIIGQAMHEGYDNPFPRLDKHDSPLDMWFLEVMRRLNDDENSDFYYKRWFNLRKGIL